MKIRLEWIGCTGDGKCALMIAKENDEWKHISVELDTDAEHATKLMNEIIRRVNENNS